MTGTPITPSRPIIPTSSERPDSVVATTDAKPDSGKTTVSIGSCGLKKTWRTLNARGLRWGARDSKSTADNDARIPLRLNERCDSSIGLSQPPGAPPPYGSGSTAIDQFGSPASRVMAAAASASTWVTDRRRRLRAPQQGHLFYRRYFWSRDAAAGLRRSRRIARRKGHVQFLG